MASLAAAGRTLALLCCLTSPFRQTPPPEQILHAIAAKAWRHMGELDGNVVTNMLYGFGLLNFNPGGCMRCCFSSRRGLTSPAVWRCASKACPP